AHNGTLPQAIVQFLTVPSYRDQLDQIIREHEATWTRFVESWNYLLQLFDPSKDISTGIVLERSDFTQLGGWCEARHNDVPLLDAYINIQHLQEEITGLSLQDLLREVLVGQVKPHDAAAAFNARFYRLWLDAVHAQSPVLGRFRTV